MFNLFDIFRDIYRRFYTWDYIINMRGYQFGSKTKSLLSCRAILFSQHQGCRFQHPPGFGTKSPASWFSFWLTLLAQKNSSHRINLWYIYQSFSQIKNSTSRIYLNIIFNIPSIHSSSPIFSSRNSSCVVPSLIAIGVSQIPKFWVC